MLQIMKDAEMKEYVSPCPVLPKKKLDKLTFVLSLVFLSFLILLQLKIYT